MSFALRFWWTKGPKVLWRTLNSLDLFVYCKRGYFRGKISRKYWQGLSRGGNFHDTTPISLMESYAMGYIFAPGKFFAN